jgi:hypothetical protein
MTRAPIQQLLRVTLRRVSLTVAVTVGVSA